MFLEAVSLAGIIQNQLVYFSNFSLFLLSSVAYAIDVFETYNLIVPGFEFKEFARSQTSRILELENTQKQIDHKKIRW